MMAQPMSETNKPKPLKPNSDEYNLVYTHLERVLEQPVGVAKGNHAALIMVLRQLGYGVLGKVEAINLAKFLVDYPEEPQDWS